MSITLFGTDGIRGAFGRGFFVSTEVARFGRAVGRWIIETYSHNRPVLIIRDTRLSSPQIFQWLVESLREYPIVVIDGGILPSGAAWHLGRFYDASCALIISASHNPPGDNGIKIVDCATGKISPESEKQIEFLYEADLQRSLILRGSLFSMADSGAHYEAIICGLFEPDLLAGKTVAIDCAEGALSVCAPRIFTKLGGTVIPYASSGDGSSINSGCGALSPIRLCADIESKKIAHNLTIGAAFDGDGDRLMIITKSGLTLDGDDLLVHYAHHVQYRNTETVVGTILTNGAVEHHLIEQKKRLIRTVVGDRAVAQSVSEFACYGGEPSGHYIFFDRGPLSDGLISALTFFELCALRDQWEWDRVDRFPTRSFSITYQKRYSLTEGAVGEAIALAEKRLYPGRLIVRYSGTEPLVRVFAEGVDAMELDHVVSLLKIELMKSFQGA